MYIFLVNDFVWWSNFVQFTSGSRPWSLVAVACACGPPASSQAPSSGCRSVRPRLTLYVCREQPVQQGQQQAAGGGGDSSSATPYGGYGRWVPFWDGLCRTSAGWGLHGDLFLMWPSMREIPNKEKTTLNALGFCFLIIFSLVFLRPHLRHMEVPRLGVKSEL